MTLLWAVCKCPAPQQTLVLYLVKAMRRRLFSRLTRIATRTFLTRDISKPWVVQADLKLLEMEIACAGTAQGSMEKPSQGKASAPGAGSGHGPGWLDRRLFRVNKKQICSKAGSEQRSSRSDLCSDCSGLCLLVLLRQGNKPSQGLLHLA